MADKLAYTFITLMSFDKVEKLDITKLLRKMLEEVDFVKSLPNKPFLLDRFISFKVDSQKISMTIWVHLTNNSRKKNPGKSTWRIKVVILLNAIPKIYRNFKNAIKDGRDTLTPEFYINLLGNKDIKLKWEKEFWEFFCKGVDHRIGKIGINEGNNRNKNNQGRSKSKIQGYK